MENLKSWDFGASNFSGTEACENGVRDPITQGECMGVHSTCLHFVGRQSLRLCLLHLRLSLQDRTVFLRLVLKLFFI